MTAPSAPPVSAERLRHLANHSRGIDDPDDIGFYECCAMASELQRAREELERLRPSPADRGKVDGRLISLRNMFQHWLDWNHAARASENLPITPDTHILTVPPHWPTRDSMKRWIETLDDAIARLSGEPAAERVIEDSDGAPISQALRDIIEERSRQISAEGWTSTHDDSEHMNGELASAGACYALRTVPRLGDLAHDLWPWSDSWWKPKDRRRAAQPASGDASSQSQQTSRQGTDFNDDIPF